MAEGQPKNVKALETGSGIRWETWLKLLEPHQDLSHTDMAKVAYEEIMKKGLAKSPEWWAQGVALAYEQHIGRRQPGQTCDGKFSVTVSKTYPGDMDRVLATWVEQVGEQREFQGDVMIGEPRLSQSEKWRYWRCTLDYGSIVSVNIQTKPSGDKSILAINHDKLESSEAVEAWRSYWRTFGQ